MPGHLYRVLAPCVRPGSAPAPFSCEAGYADGRALGEIGLGLPRFCGRTRPPTWPLSLRLVGVRVRLLIPPPPTPELEGSDRGARSPLLHLVVGRLSTPIRPAFISTRVQQLHRFVAPSLRAARSSCSLQRPRSATRTSACAPTASSSGVGSASKRPSPRTRDQNRRICGGGRGSRACGLGAIEGADSTFADAVVSRPPV